MMRHVTAGLWAAAMLLGLASPAGSEEPPSPQWWERGQDTWCYKDDWKGLYLQNAGDLKATVEVAEKPVAAYAYVWASGPCTFKVNGQVLGRDVDEGTIEDYDLAAHLLAGANTIEVLGGGEVICEGAAVLESGKEVHFASDATWAVGRRVQASPVRRRGPRGYAGDTHMARILEVTAEQKAKALVNRLNSARVRILDRDRYLYWKNRDPREVLTLDRPTPEREAWAQVERLLEEARGPVAEASALVKAGRFEDAARAAAPAVASTEEAERRVADLLRSLAAQADRRAAALAAEMPDAAGHVTYNGSAHNRLGWVASCEPLDNDPAWWEFDIAPPGAASIALAGWWQFQTDPSDRGAAEGVHTTGYDAASAMKSIYAPLKWGWERYGVVDYNPGVKGWNKPYNGCAWYRKTLVIPAEWEGSDLILRLGPRWNNADWLAVNGQWVNDPSGPPSGADAMTVPARLVRFGQENTIALRVLNRDNIGGIVNPGLRLSVAAKEPKVRRHPCGPGAVRETVFDASGGRVTQVIYSSALSPAAVVATDAKAVRLFGWHARGRGPPWWCTYVRVGGQPFGLMLAQRDLVDQVAETMGENWLLLRQADGGPHGARPLLVVFERRPQAVAWVDDGFGGKALELRFAQAGARLLLARPFDADPGDRKDAPLLERCRLWSRALVRYPVGYLERLRYDGPACRVRMLYEYLEVDDDWKATPIRLAPLPMLFSYAVERGWPGAAAEGKVMDLGCRARSPYYPRMDCGTYRVILDRADASYAFDRLEPAVRFMGAGTLGEEKRLGEPMYARMKAWGFSAYRPQTGIPAAADYADAARIAEFQKMLDLAQRHNLVCFVNWFTGQGVPKDKRQDFVDRWVAMARHCRDLPEGAVVYNFINEPAGFRWDDYNAFMKEVTAAVRKVDGRHWLSVEFGGGWAQPEDADMTEPTGDPKTIYQFHFYGPHTGDCHREDLWYPRYQRDEERFRSYESWEERMLAPIRFAIRRRAEVMHGEFGISFLGPDDAPRRWLEDVLSVHAKYRMHWNWWNYSGNDIHRTGLVAGERVNPLAEALSRYATAPPPP